MSYKVTIKYISPEKKKYFIVFDESVSTYIKGKFPNETFLEKRVGRSIPTGDQPGAEVDMVFSSKNVYDQIMADPVVSAKMKEFDAYNTANNIKVIITGTEV